MKSIRGCRQNQLFWVEFMVMLGVLLLVTAMTLVGVMKAHQMNQKNKVELGASMTMQNLIEYCKVNVDNIDKQLESLGAVELEKLEDQSKWEIYYDQDWNIAEPTDQAEFRVEINIKKTIYTHGALVDLKMMSYALVEEPISALEGSVIVKGGEKAEDESTI